ncbi:acyl-CoA dehydrogenase [Pelobium manganitolerans]|uniref:acyl-CoA dehydrogenase n=1 Tax=Pelobium manganitolerans TaxID=1842495 RepID=UPI003FA3C4A7
MIDVTNSAVDVSTTLFNNQLAAKAESLGYLPDEWLQYIYDEKLFKLFVPKRFNGLGLGFTDVLRKEEKLAGLDGSLAWTVTLCAGAMWFIGFLAPSLSEEVFTDEKVCFAGSGFVGGTANLVGDKYLINGNWTYASGALHATHFTANCEILEHGKPVLDAKGKAVVKAFLLKKQEVTILDGWSYMGMIATGSHSFETKNTAVPLNRAFDILPNKTKIDDPIYKYPFRQLAESTLVVNILGLSLRFLELVDECFYIRNQKRNYDQEHLAYYEALKTDWINRLQSLKKEFYEAVEQSWQELNTERQISDKTLALVSKNSRTLAVNCRDACSKLHPFSGLEAAKNHTAINRVWRDLNTVSQHALLIFPF